MSNEQIVYWHLWNCTDISCFHKPCSDFGYASSNSYPLNGWMETWLLTGSLPRHVTWSRIDDVCHPPCRSPPAAVWHSSISGPLAARGLPAPGGWTAALHWGTGLCHQGQPKAWGTEGVHQSINKSKQSIKELKKKTLSISICLTISDCFRFIWDLFYYTNHAISYFISVHCPFKTNDFILTQSVWVWSKDDLDWERPEAGDLKWMNNAFGDNQLWNQ